MITDLPTEHISNVTVAKISRHFAKNGGKNDGHECETKLHHCYPCCACDVHVSVFRDLTAICDTAASLDIKIMVMLWKTVSR